MNFNHRFPVGGNGFEQISLTDDEETTFIYLCRPYNESTVNGRGFFGMIAGTSWSLHIFEEANGSFTAALNRNGFTQPFDVEHNFERLSNALYWMYITITTIQESSR